MWRKWIFVLLLAAILSPWSLWAQPSLPASSLSFSVPVKDSLTENLDKLDKILDELLLVSLTSNEASEKLLLLLPEVQNKLILLSTKLESSQATLQEQLSLFEQVKTSLKYSEESQRKYRSDTLLFSGVIGVATIASVILITLLH